MSPMKQQRAPWDEFAEKYEREAGHLPLSLMLEAFWCHAHGKTHEADAMIRNAETIVTSDLKGERHVDKGEGHE